MSDDLICPNQRYGKHIVVRCQGCGSRHSTKNIGQTDPETKVVFLERHLFDIYHESCQCKDKREFPLVHDCTVDDLDYDYDHNKFIPIKKEEVKDAQTKGVGML